MSNEDGSKMGVNPEAGEKQAGGLFKTVDGQRVMRQLTTQEMGIYSPLVITTPEGFNIRGVNETSLIRDLKILNGMKIDDIESRMREGMPARGFGGRLVELDYFKRIRYLGHNESFVDSLAQDNDAVLNGLHSNHQILGNFLLYFDDLNRFIFQQDLKRIRRESALKHPDRRGGSVVGIGTTSGVELYEYNGFVFKYKRELGEMGAQISPIDGEEAREQITHTVTRDINGHEAGVRFSETSALMGYRYGFWGGLKSNQRLDPVKIARLAGMDSSVKK